MSAVAQLQHQHGQVGRIAECDPVRPHGSVPAGFAKIGSPVWVFVPVCILATKQAACCVFDRSDFLSI